MTRCAVKDETHNCINAAGHAGQHWCRSCGVYWGSRYELGMDATGIASIVAAELKRHGTLIWKPKPHCTCGHEFIPLRLGGVSWDRQNEHRSQAVAAALVREDAAPVPPRPARMGQ